MRKTVCICGEQEVVVVGERDERTVGTCVICNQMRTLEIADDYGALYTEGLRYHAERDGHAAYTDRTDHDACVGLSRVPRHMSATDVRLLDVGCANGGYILSAQAAGLRVEGLEVNPTMAAYARETTQTLVHEGWETVLGRFTLITYHDVLEHIEDPVAELVRAKQFLQPRGVIAIDTPDTDDERFALLGMNWHHMKPREHLWFWNKHTIQQVFRNAGLSLIRFDTPIQGKLVAYVR